MGKRCDWIVFSVDEKDLVPGLDALEAACESLFGVDFTAGRWPESFILGTERADVLLVLYAREILFGSVDAPQSVTSTDTIN